jgi:hypothetical protein
VPFDDRTNIENGIIGDSVINGVSDADWVKIIYER